MQVHSIKPNRNVVPQRPRYSAYRNELRADFNNACGYCDDSDIRIDRISFHIDHFAPQDIFPHLVNSYSNLVYTCRFCNRAKWDKWVGDNENIPNNGLVGFIDPCHTDYEIHLGRATSGNIVGNTPLGE
jgi:uncharacterized protein (TIGR02646 family)